jgi:asparagine synthase (glutamine-hydrolysing)
MCGICGKLYFEQDRHVDPLTIKRMADSMHHRGPDDGGAYVSGNVGLGHRRLSIIDLMRGKQPISNEDERLWIVFNGEIYNYQELRQVLLSNGHKFRTDTDTEVILHGYEEYGEACVAKLRGMFAFAIWDDRKKILFIARDRVGIKPLYYYIDSEQVVFGSELKAILQDTSVPREINLPIIDRFLTYYYVPGEETLLKGIQKLSPGHSLVVRDGKIEIRQYWDLTFCSDEYPGSFDEASEELLDILKESVRLHMISDVPVGFLLSGGVDSTAMLGLSTGQTDKELSTFTIGFDGENFADERPYARLAAKRFGTRHYDMTIRAQDFLEFLPRYVWHMEEPVCEPPAVALYYVSRLASAHVKVLISGEGGDEAFAGYPNYRNLVWLGRLKRFTGPFKSITGNLLQRVADKTGSRRIGKYAPFFSQSFDQYYFSRTSGPFSMFNRSFRELYSADFANLVNKQFAIEPTVRCLTNGNYSDYLSKMLYTDTKTWLPDDLLIKADKMTMANSVELRVPLLDHKVLEFSASLPSNYKLHGLTTKFTLKNALRSFVPKEIIERKKTGFPVPYETWMRKELKGMVEDLILNQKARNRRYFHTEGIKRILGGNLRRGTDSKEVFSLLTLELWHRQFIDEQHRES